MPELRTTLMIIGLLLSTLGCAMMVPGLYELALGDEDWLVFAGCSSLTLLVGVLLTYANRTEERELSIKQAFLLTTLAWVVLVAFSALPFVWSGRGASYTDAFFEAMSGLTTTGATVFTGLDTFSPGLLLWRAILQWLGGIGIIVMGFAVLPMLRIGGMQLFRIESSDASEKMLPRAKQIALNIIWVYLTLSAACVVSYLATGMSAFDSVAHAMTTIATGGFSTYDASIAHFDSRAVETVAIVFMLLGSLPFLLLFQGATQDPRALIGDSQVRWFFGIVAIGVGLAWLAQAGAEQLPGSDAFRHASFNVVSIVTGTGYATRAYDTWSTFAAMLFMVLMFVGGCAGSTSCGMKIFRFQVLFETVRQRVLMFSQPHRVVIATYNGKRMDPAVARAVMNFVFLFLLSFGVIACLLSAYGLDSVTALSASASALANVGPGLGPEIGPAGNYAGLPDGVKWILSFAMLLGRLEILTVLVLFTPVYWRS
ncbi:MAG: TrkH family potassium uptake protein [Pseudomonadota bacterium]